MSSRSIKNKLFSKEFWKSRNGQLTFCIVGGLLSVIFLLSQFGVFSGDLMPDEKDREKLEKELKKLQADQSELEAELAEQDAVRKRAAAKFDGAWKNSLHGVPEVELRSKLENTARELDLRFNSLSTVKRSSFNDEISMLEIDMDLTVIDMSLLMRFLMAVHEMDPELYWKRFEFRMANYYGMPAIRFNGSLRCINDLRPEKNGRKNNDDKNGSGGNK